MDRHSDVYSTPHRDPLPPLPAIDWSAVGHSKPRHIEIDYKGKDAPLPEADLVVMTWTAAEWSALDHVFLNSDSTRYPSSRKFEDDWLEFSQGAPELPKGDGAYPPPPLWGFYRMVGITDAGGSERTVLLFKADAHLAHPLWIKVLEQMAQRVIEQTKASKVYSIGTAGGTSLSENLGDAAITNAAHISLENENNTVVDYNNTTFTGAWYPNLDLLPEVESKLLFPLNRIINNDELNAMLGQLYERNPGAKNLKLGDLINAPLEPANLGAPRGLKKDGVPLLTTDYYYIAKGDDSVQYCVLEMDDAVIAKVAEDLKVGYCFVRNISDPLVPDTAQNGDEIPFDVRKDWSGVIYENFGIYSSFNGALLCWATIAGDPG